MDSSLSRPDRRRALAMLRKKAKAGPPSIPDVAGNRETRRARLVHVHKQGPISSRKDTVKKKKYRRWLRKHGLPITRWNYLGCVLPA